MRQVIESDAESGDGVCIEREQPSTAFRPMIFTVTKFDPKAPNILDSLEKAGWKAPEETIEYLKNISKNGYFSIRFEALTGIDATKLTTFTEKDRVTNDVDIHNGLHALSSIEATRWNDTITINQIPYNYVVGTYGRGVFATHETIDVYGYEGDDEIINYHQNDADASSFPAVVNAYGGCGYDQFASYGNSRMHVQDMELGETFTVDGSNTSAGYVNPETWGIGYPQSGGMAITHQVNVGEGEELIRLTDEQGNSVFVLVPEI